MESGALFLLRAVSLAGNESPLHTACLSVRLEFAMEIIHLSLLDFNDVEKYCKKARFLSRFIN